MQIGEWGSISWMMKERNAWNEWYFIRQLLVNLYGKIDADPWRRKQMFIYTDGQHVETSIGSIV